MDLNKLTAISPIDGRYRKQVDHIAKYFSEFGLIKYRIQVEIEYFIALCKIPLPQLKEVQPEVYEELRNIYASFSEQDALKVKEIERITNHDVKAVEYFIKEEFDKLGLKKLKEFIH
ncbi:MAG: adenylosuccinate lyase, partial [Cyclobacteriaceae bacterium]|nr:adenylosuccinate lyase [Cyclobacteriaceae bacterium]